jgi:hypothetical protein
MRVSISIKAAPIFVGAVLCFSTVFAQPDTLKVMAYNVLYYGDTPPCQFSHTVEHGYLSTILSYVQPDIVGLDKVEAIPTYVGDASGTAPMGFQDSILQFAFNSWSGGIYSVCPFSNASAGDNIDLLFYNHNKLGFAGIASTYANVTDFNTYKLYYKDADLATTHDTLFLYVTPNHDKSGTSSSEEMTRAGQIAGYMGNLTAMFSELPNYITMGDFNTHNSTETVYQELVSPIDPGYRMYDPPYYPDGLYTYPGNWDTDPAACSKNLTYVTRASGSHPNSCGNGGGATLWYDHLFISKSLMDNTDRIQYVANSYTTVGNDGNRLDISVNDLPTNTSAPSTVIDALYNFTDKYPVTARFAVAPSTSAVKAVGQGDGLLKMANPVGDHIRLFPSAQLDGVDLDWSVGSISGMPVLSGSLHSVGGVLDIPVDLVPGTYLFTVRAPSGAHTYLFTKI